MIDRHGCLQTFGGLMETVVEELASVVSDLQDLGIGKVLVCWSPDGGERRRAGHGRRQARTQKQTQRELV